MGADTMLVISIIWAAIGQFVLFVYLVEQQTTSELQFWLALAVCTGPIGIALGCLMQAIAALVGAVRLVIRWCLKRASLPRQ